MIRGPRRRAFLLAAFAATLLLLLAHAWVYRFLCDDAFISFRYARNLAHGYGLVFNPGHGRVEGYTNFLWVLVLAAFDAVGLLPEKVAPVLSILLTIGLWGLVARAAWRWLPGAASKAFALVPLAWLGLTRSIAVWSTGGLETRLFEVLVVAATVRLAADVAVRTETDDPRPPWAAVLFGLAVWTRPDAMLIAAAAMGAAAVLLWRRGRLRARDVLASALALGAIVGAQFAFRLAYYHAWLPNTYYAKVGGRSWWSMGADYLGAFGLEYAVWLWIPAVAAGALAFVRERRSEVPLLAAAVVLPHLLYVASIGGDHFEYRPLDLYFPLAYLVMARGIVALWESWRRRGLALGYAAAIALGLVVLPWDAHREFPSEYIVGFPGAGAAPERRAFLDPSRDPLTSFPPMSLVAGAYASLLRRTTAHFVGIRQEEHRLFLSTVEPEGKRLRELVAKGALPADTYIAVSSVGAIPYFSGLRTLDRLGLTDAAVARTAPGELRIMAHEHHATIDYARREGVDLWAEHPVHLLFRLSDDDLLRNVDRARGASDPAFYADVGDGRRLLVQLPQGFERAAARFPELRFRAVADPDAYRALLDATIAVRRDRARGDPSAANRLSLAAAYSARGDEDEAIAVFRRLADEGNAEGWYNLGTLEAKRGRYDRAAADLSRAVAADPTLAFARYNLGMALARLGRIAEAKRELAEAARLDPGSAEVVYATGVVALMSGNAKEAAAAALELHDLATMEGERLARRLDGAIAARAARAP